MIMYDNKSYYSTKLVAEILKKSSSYVRNLLQKNILSSTRIGGRLYIEKKTLNQYIKYLQNIENIKNKHIQIISEVRNE